MKQDPVQRFLELLRASVADETLIKLTLGSPVPGPEGLRNLFVRPVKLKAGLKLAFVWRYKTRDITKNLDRAEAVRSLEGLVGSSFHDAHLFTTCATVQLEGAGLEPRLRVLVRDNPAQPVSGNDRAKIRPIAQGTEWLQALGVTDASGRPRPSMADKLRQIQRFAEILSGLVAEAGLGGRGRVSAFDMGCGKGYLTFALSELLGPGSSVCGVEARPELARFCNDTAVRVGLGDRLSFLAGTIDGTQVANADILVALHACDTATDEAIAKGVRAGARLIVVAPCCQKELRPQMVAPGVLAPALRHGIFMERQAEFATDALRSLLLEHAGYSTKVFEFISSEHTAKNTMIAAVASAQGPRPEAGEAIRALASFYGIRRQSLAELLGVPLA